MASGKRLVSVTYPAAGDLSTSQYRILTMESDGQVNTIGAGTAPVIGVLQNKPAGEDQGAEVAIVGSDVKFEAGAQCSAGQFIVAVTGGRGSPIASGGTAHVAGICTQAAAGSGAIGALLVMPQKVVAA